MYVSARRRHDALTQIQNSACGHSAPAASDACITAALCAAFYLYPNQSLSTKRALGALNTPFALDTTTLTLWPERDQRGGFATVRLCAHHVTLPDRSRGATDSGLFKSEQSSKGF